MEIGDLRKYNESQKKRNTFSPLISNKWLTFQTHFPKGEQGVHSIKSAVVHVTTPTHLKNKTTQTHIQKQTTTQNYNPNWIHDYCQQQDTV